MSARLVIASAAVLLAATPAFTQEPSPGAGKQAKLAVGSPAPALSIEKWVKGAPVGSFEKGKTYVVEFWATWCGPCIASMPHLSELQRKYKDKGVTIIGVTSKDPRNDLPAVEAMVKDKGAGMDYSVAWDKERQTGEAYMRAAGQNGIPCSFLVDGSGKIAYIGNPKFLDVPLEQVLAGTWDPVKGNAAVAEIQGRLGEINKAIRSDPKNAIPKITEFEAKYPEFASMVASLRFDALLLAGDFQAAYVAGGKLVDEAIAHKDSVELNMLAWKIVDPDAKWAKVDLDLALRAAEKGVEFTKEKDAAVLDTLARVHFLKGDTKKAIEVQTKAVAVCTPEMKESIEQTLADYKAKASQ